MNILSNSLWLSSRTTTRTQVAFSGRSKMHCSGLGSHLLPILLIAALLISACGASAQPSSAPDEAASAPEEAANEAAQPANGKAAALEPAARNNLYDAAPEMTIDPEAVYFATFKTENGDMRVRLFADQAPVTVNNFIFLARDGFYNNTHFHRVLENFMAQGGDPIGSGAGGPGYQFQDETVPDLQFDRAGLLAMANAGPDTNGSQFFITFAETPWLNGNHTIFGEVVEGTDVLFSLTIRDPMAAGASEFPGDLLITVEIDQAEQ